MRLSVAARSRGFDIKVADVLRNPVLSDLTALASGRFQCKEVVEDLNHEYQAFSTVSKTEADVVKRIACSHLNLQESEIQDIGRATDYQIENLSWSSLQKRAGTNYITFDFGNLPDSSRLQDACSSIVSQYAILRTVYFINQHCVYQVSLQSVSYEIVHCHNTKNVDEETNLVIRKDMKEHLDISKPLVKFSLLQRDNTAMRMIMRASNLQYDGVTLIHWCRELGAVCAGKVPGPNASFIGYSHFAAELEEHKAEKFWTNLLAGSKMTNIFKHTHLQYENVLDGQVESIMDSDKVRSHPDITIGTTIKAAWSLVLAEMSKTDDVVFGSVVWGRNAPYPGAGSVAGAYIDNIPVRVRFDHVKMSRLDLLRQVQNQYFQAIPFESYRYKRIVEKCTDWRPWERLSTLVEYENLGEESTTFQFGQGSIKVDEIRPPGDRHDIKIYSMPLGSRTFIALDFCKMLVSERIAQSMLDRLCFHINCFHEDVFGPMVLTGHEGSLLPQIPLELGNHTVDEVNGATNSRGSNLGPIYDSAITKTTAGENTCNIFGPSTGGNDSLKGLVEEAWISVMCCPAEKLSKVFELGVPFFELWGNLIAALALAKFYQEIGFSVRMEDVLENPSMRLQVMLPQCKEHIELQRDS